jgi:fatty acid desaturase
MSGTAGLAAPGKVQQNARMLGSAVAAPVASRHGVYAPYRGVLLSPRRVRELTVLRPALVVRDTALLWLTIVAAWAAVAWWTTWWMVLLMIPVIGTRYYALFLIGHDGMHRRLFPNVRRNDLFCDLFLLGPVGGINRYNNRNHLEHHRNLATEDDPDRHKHGCFNKTTTFEYGLFLTGVANLVPAVLNVFTRAPRKVAASGSGSRPRYTGRDMLILVGWQAGLIAGLSAAIGWWAYPVLWLVPCYVFFYGADLIRSFAEHSHPERDSVADAHRLVTFVSHPLERIVVAPVNMNYHAAHHLWPTIPYYNLPQADAEMRASSAAARGLLWRGSYVAYLWRYFRALPLPECRR